MRCFFLLGIIIFFSNKIKAQDFFDTSYYQNGKIQQYGKYDLVKKCWYQFDFYYSGGLRSIEQFDSSYFPYKNSTIGYNMNGTKAFEYHFLNSHVDGIFEFYDSIGRIKKKGNFFNGFKTGVWTEFYTNGKVSKKCNYNLNKQDSILNEDSFSNGNSIIKEQELIEIGLVDESLGKHLKYINLMKFSFSYYIRSSFSCKEFAEK